MRWNLRFMLAEFIDFLVGVDPHFVAFPFSLSLSLSFCPSFFPPPSPSSYPLCFILLWGNEEEEEEEEEEDGG